jgi:DNA-binding GntR family transcriptional regulator
MTIGMVEPIRRRSLHDELVGRLREMIIEGHLAPGEKLSEQALGDLFHVSRTPLREALKVLATEGLIDIRPNRGASVAALTIADLDEAFPIMGALEALSGELACQNATDQQIERAQALHRQMVEKYQAGALSAYFRVNEKIHEVILEAAGNRTLEKMQHGLAGRVRRARYMANMSPARWEQAVGEHEEIIAAFAARDGKRLGQILKRHLANKLEAVKVALAG